MFFFYFINWKYKNKYLWILFLPVHIHVLFFVRLSEARRLRWAPVSPESSGHFRSLFPPVFCSFFHLLFKRKCNPMARSAQNSICCRFQSSKSVPIQHIHTYIYIYICVYLCLYMDTWLLLRLLASVFYLYFFLLFFFYMGKWEKLQTKAATATDAPYKGSMQRFKAGSSFFPIYFVKTKGVGVTLCWIYIYTFFIFIFIFLFIFFCKLGSIPSA